MESQTQVKGPGTEDAAAASITGRFRARVAGAADKVGSSYPVFALVTTSTFAISIDHGTFDTSARSSLAVATCWVLVAGLVAGAWPRSAVGRPVSGVTALLLAFALLSGFSTFWGASAEDAFVEANRVVLYLGIFLLVALASRGSTLAAWSDALGAAAALIAIVALLSRLFRGLFAEGALPTFLPYAHTRLSFPVDYWNGLAILVALGVPLLLRTAVAASPRWMRAIAVMPFPVIALVIYLASSRTGAITAFVGAAVFIALAEDRWAAVGALATGAIASAVALAWTVHEHALVNGPLSSAAARSEGRWTALVVLATCALAGALQYGGSFVAHERRPSRVVGWTATVALVVAAAAAVTAAHPVRQFENFKRPPTPVAAQQYIQNHFLSTNGNYRWQYWAATVHEFEQHPFGGGAGSFEPWWAQHGTTVGFVRNAHSLYFEVLGELGPIGVLFLVAAFATAIGVGAARAVGAPSGRRTTLAAVTAGLSAYAVAAGLDWMWQLTAVSVLGMALLGLSVAPAGAPRPPPRRPSAWRRSLRIVAVSVGLVALAAEATVLAVELKIDDSQAAVRRGDLNAAAAAARTARSLEPWAASPRLQLALVQEQAGDLERARESIEAAIRRDPRDWRLWLSAARIQTKLGRIETARADLHRAIELNPRSPIFAAAPKN